MKTAARMPDPAGIAPWRVQDAWTAFWQDPGQSRCAAGAPGAWHSLTQHWHSFAQSLAQGSRVLDLGCGAGAVARLILERADVDVTGVDFARVPLTMQPNLALLSETAMEVMPFAAGSFGAVVSQFGFEYSQRDQAAREIARVAAPGATLSFLVHHADSAIVATNRARVAVLAGFLGATVRTAFCAGDAPSFTTQMTALAARFPRDALIAELARSLPGRLARAQPERVAIWKALDEALAPERCLADSLHASCVAPAQLPQWLAPLRAVCALQDTEVLREPDGTPIAWQLHGIVQGG